MDIHLRVTAGGISVLYLLVIVADLLLIGFTAASDMGREVIHPAIARHFDLKQEGVLAVWYSSALLLLNCMACLFVAFRQGLGRWHRAAWLTVAMGFLALSADETAQVHEMVGKRMGARGLGMAYVPESNPVFNWLAPAIPLGVLFGAALLAASRSWSRAIPRGRRLAVAGLACWVGVLAMEFVESQMVRYGMERALQGALEEGLELAGATLFLVALVESLKGGWESGAFADGKVAKMKVC